MKRHTVDKRVQDGHGTVGDTSVRVDLLEDWRCKSVNALPKQDAIEMGIGTHPCRCKKSRSPCGSWSASSCHQRRQASCQQPWEPFRKMKRLEKVWVGCVD